MFHGKKIVVVMPAYNAALNLPFNAPTNAPYNAPYNAAYNAPYNAALTSAANLGDTVVFGKYSGTEVEIKGAAHKIMRESELLGLIEG